MPLSLDSAGQADDATPGDLPYCSLCYRAGKFVMPDLTVEQMHARVFTKLLEVGVPESRARKLAHRITSLQRWKADA